MSVLATALTVAIIAAPIAPAQAPAPAASAGGFGLRVVAEAGAEAPTSIAESAAPGAVVTRMLVAYNDSASSVDLDVYAASADESPDDGFTIRPDREQNELSSWTTLTPAHLSLAPGQTAPVTLTVAVPSDATASERHAVLWSQTAGQPDSTGSVTATRVGMRLRVAVGGGNGPTPQFSLGTPVVTSTPDGRRITVGLHNFGRATLRPRATLALADGPDDLRVDPLTVTTDDVAADGRTTLSFPLDEVIPPGQWHLTVTVTDGPTSHTTDTTTELPAAGKSSSATGASSIGSPARLTIPAAIAVAAGTILLAVSLRRRRNKQTVR